MKEFFVETRSETVWGSHCVRLEGKPLTIGRHGNNVIVVADEGVSRHHCVVELADDEVIVRDLESRNGTKVNGEEIQMKVLAEGDIIQVGQTRFRFTSKPRTATGVR